MKEIFKSMMIALGLCYLVSQIVFLVTMIVPAYYCVFFDRFFADGLFIFMLSSVPILFSSVVMTCITKWSCVKRTPSYLNYLWATGLTLLVFFTIFPFYGTFQAPYFRMPAREEWGFLLAAVTTGLAGTYSLNLFWFRKNCKAQQNDGQISSESALSDELST